MKQIWHFENINLFDLLCPHQLKNYSMNHHFLNYKKNEYIYLEGDIAKNFFLISKGKVKIGFWDETGEEVVLSYLNKGDIFGESIVLNQNTRKEFAQSVDYNTELCPVNIDQSEQLIRGNKNFSIGIFKFIGFRVKKIERMYRIMLFRNTRTRAIEFIKELKEDNGGVELNAAGDLKISNPYSQMEFAKLIGTSRPTFNILIKELQDEGYLIWQKGAILLKNKFLLEF